MKRYPVLEAPGGGLLDLGRENCAIRGAGDVEAVNLFENVRLQAVVLIQRAGLPPHAAVGDVGRIDNKVVEDFALEAGRPLNLTRRTLRRRALRVLCSVLAS